MRKLVQDFLTLSNLESGRVEWHQESYPRRVYRTGSVPERSRLSWLAVTAQVPDQLPLVRAVAIGWLSTNQTAGRNACKFTPARDKSPFRLTAMALRCCRSLSGTRVATLNPTEDSL